LTLKLYGIPETIMAAICSFPTARSACDATIYTIQSGLSVARIEFLDAVQVKAVNAYSKLTLPESPLLLLEFHGSEAGVREQIEAFRIIAEQCGGDRFEWAEKPEDRTRLWQARHDVHWASQTLRPGARITWTDVCVPISRLAECMDETRLDMEASGLIGPIVGHVGDGNFHTGLLIMVDDPDEIANAERYLERLAERAIRMNGTCTGEHGIGQGKIRYLEAELGADTVEVMRVIKRAIDPDNVMNPGKIFRL
jgi:D-lactate dehydrogenase (cytochrome)